MIHAHADQVKSIRSAVENNRRHVTNRIPMKKIGIGYEDYKRIIDDNCYYVDKTFMIQDVVEKGGMVTLFMRPRRFGKTLTLSMIQTFFEEEYDCYIRIVRRIRQSCLK